MSPNLSREIGSLTEVDLQRCRVWQFVHADNSDGVALVPVSDFPVASLIERIVATQIRLANGDKYWATVQGFVSGDRVEMQRSLSLSVLFEGKRVFLRDTGMYDIETYSPKGFCQALGLAHGDVFPISFDVSDVVTGYAQAVKGVIEGNAP